MNQQESVDRAGTFNPTTGNEHSGTATTVAPSGAPEAGAFVGSLHEIVTSLRRRTVTAEGEWPLRVAF